jgi:hypothetical protein
MNFDTVIVCVAYVGLPLWKFVSHIQSRNKGGASGALAPGAVHVGAQNEYN